MGILIGVLADGFFWSTVTAAVAGGIGVTAAFISAIVGYNVTDVLQREANTRISEANARGEEAKEAAALANERAAQAGKRAAEANLALAKFKAPRLPTDKDLAFITEKLKPFSGMEFDTGLSNSSGEQADFLWRLEPALVNAGWIHISWTGAGLFVQQGMRPVSGTVAASNVEIHVHPQNKERFSPAVKAFVSAFKAVGIEARDAGFNANSDNINAIHILIGDKR